MTDIEEAIKRIETIMRGNEELLDQAETLRRECRPLLDSHTSSLDEFTRLVESGALSPAIRNQIARMEEELHAVLETTSAVTPISRAASGRPKRPRMRSMV